MHTYSIYSAQHSDRAETHTGALNELRAWLLGEAERWGWNIEGLQDIADALNDGEPLADATEGEVRAIASRVWDVPEKHVLLTPLSFTAEVVA